MAVMELTAEKLNVVYEEQRVRDTILEPRHKTRMALIDLKRSLRQL